MTQHVMQKDGGEGTVKLPSISMTLLALKAEAEGHDGFATFFILYVSVPKLYIFKDLFPYW